MHCDDHTNVTPIVGQSWWRTSLGAESKWELECSPSRANLWDADVYGVVEDKTSIALPANLNKCWHVTVIPCLARSGTNLTPWQWCRLYGVGAVPVKAVSRSLHCDNHVSIRRPSQYHYLHCQYLTDMQPEHRYQESLLARLKPNYMTSSRTSCINHICI